MPATVVVPIVIVLVVAVNLYLSKNYDYECSQCGHRFDPSLASLLLSSHSFGRKLLRCPHCGSLAWASRVPKQADRS